MSLRSPGKWLQKVQFVTMIMYVKKQIEVLYDFFRV